MPTACSPAKRLCIRPLLKDDMDKVLPVIIRARARIRPCWTIPSNFLMMSGMPLPLAVMITIPEPWSNDPDISRRKKDFYRYYATMMEPWDGPAAILFSDGDIVGAVLDRNGLRPSRYYITKDNQLILSSEVGVLDIQPREYCLQIASAAGQDAACRYGPKSVSFRIRSARIYYSASQSPTANGLTATW